MGKKDKNFWSSAALNNSSYIQYYNRLLELAMAMFDWKNLPSTVDQRFMELALLSQGKAVFFEDEVLGYMALRCVGNGPFDAYGNPVNRIGVGANGFNSRSLNETDSVIVWNNMLRTNNLLDIKMFAMRLYNIDRAIDVNANAQKTPVLITCEENQRLTMLNLYKQFDGNEPFIFGNKALDTRGIQVLKTDAPFVADRLFELKANIWNEALTYLGITNVTFTKKQRVVRDEVLRAQGGTIASRFSRLNARRQACEQINEMFGLDIWCDFRDCSGELDADYVIEESPDRDDGYNGDGTEVVTIE